MNASRRDFIKIGAVAGATVIANGLEGATGAVAQNADAAASLPAPEGADFAGMAGAYAALITPYKKDGSINEEMIERIVEHGLANGLRGFYLTGSTGEGFLLSADERVRVYERAVKAARGRAKMIAHVGCLSTDDAVSLARRAAKAGVDWVSSVAPVYFGQNFDAAFAHYNAIAGATDLPFMIYSVGAQVVPDRDVRFFEIPNVKGMKYTGYAYWTVKQLKRRLPKPAIFFAGADEQELCAFAYGDTFSGCIGTTDNMIPAHHARICALAAEGRFAEAQPLMDDVVRFVELVVSAPNASCWKSVMRYIGLDCGPARSPAGQPLNEADYQAYAAKVDALGFIERNDANA
ncbi:MAG: dihydrodipicolinate synthase family protein [Kiritimatiellae bacterium]|nr:dihydrodipicolinate synthase family protein [Kiritimatiellia bacterium]